MTGESSIKYELLDLLTAVGDRVLSNRPALNFLIRVIREYTCKEDWEPGNRAVIYKQVSELAFECGVNRRTITNYEHAICSAFGVKVVSSYNGRRTAERCPDTNRIIFAYGLELSGLREMLPILQAIKDEFEALFQRRRDLKHRLNRMRGRVRRLATVLYCLCRENENAELEAQGRELAESIRGRVPDQASLIDLEQMILASERCGDELEKLLVLCKSCGSDVEVSHPCETTFLPIQHPINNQSYPSDNCSPVVEKRTVRRGPLGQCGRSDEYRHKFTGLSFVPPELTGADRIHPDIAYRAASDWFAEHLPSDVSAAGVVEAARCYAGELGVDRDAWNYACQVVGEYPAALCLLVTDNAHKRPDDWVLSTGKYFSSLIQRAKLGKLALDRSIFRAYRSVSAEAGHA